MVWVPWKSNRQGKTKSPQFWMIKIPYVKDTPASSNSGAVWMCIGTPNIIHIIHSAPLGRSRYSLWWNPIFLMASGLPVGWRSSFVSRFQALGYWSQNSPSFDDSDLEPGGFWKTGRAFRATETAFWKTAVKHHTHTIIYHPSMVYWPTFSWFVW